jgi:hypothetical protein
MDKPYATTTKENIEILHQDIEEDVYGFTGEVVFRMKHNQKVFRVSSIHLDQSTLLKNVGIEFNNQPNHVDRLIHK